MLNNGIICITPQPEGHWKICYPRAKHYVAREASEMITSRETERERDISKAHSLPK